MHAYVIRFYKITIKQKDVKPCIWKMNKDLRWIIKIMHGIQMIIWYKTKWDLKL